MDNKQIMVEGKLMTMEKQMTRHNETEENAITNAIAETFGFDIIEGSTGDIFYKCYACGKRYKECHYGPLSNNDRMIMHAKIHGITHERKG